MIRLSCMRPLLATLTAALLGGCAINPDPLSQEFLAANAADKLERVSMDQEPIDGTIDLYEAMARAMKYNLDHLVEQREASLRITELDLSNYSMLPSATVNAGYTDRDKVAASSSYNLLTQSPNFGFSTSQDDLQKSADLTFSWHVLDFGLSLVRARQAADKALIAEENRRKVLHRLMEDVRTAYWRAWSAQKLVGRLRTLEKRTKAAVASSNHISTDLDTSPLSAITYRRELIELQRVLQELQRELAVAKFQLAALMNVAPNTPFKLATPSKRDRFDVATDMSHLVQFAIENRPEIHDVAYRQRINKNEANAALLEMLPGIQVFGGRNFDSNSFLLHDYWLGWGAKATWNLLKVFQLPARYSVIEAQDDLLDARALALTMAIMTQVHVSGARLIHLRSELSTAAAYYTAQQEVVRNIRAEYSAERVSEQTLLREELNAAVGELRLDIAWSGAQSAYANLVSSIGADPLPGWDIHQIGVGDLAETLRQSGNQATSQFATLEH